MTNYLYYSISTPASGTNSQTNKFFRIKNFTRWIIRDINIILQVFTPNGTCIRGYKEKKALN